MAVPTWREFMVPTLEVLNDGQVRRLRELCSMVANKVSLNEAERTERLSGGEIKYENRIGWATSYLTPVGALDRPARGRYQITRIGRRLLAERRSGITEQDLRALAEGDDSLNTPQRWSPGRPPGGATDPSPDTELDPIEQILRGIARIDADVADDLLTRLHSKEPAFFKLAVVKLLVAMGYGGAVGAARVTQQSNDEGIDGIIDQDRLVSAASTSKQSGTHEISR